MFLRYFHISAGIFYHVGTQLDQKVEVNFKIFDITDWTTNNYNQVLPNKIEYNMRSIFLEISYTKCGGDSPRAFKKSKWSKSLDQQSEMLKSLFFILNRS